ncbi:hypothetical protein CBL_14297 [Carabus blaptoides fortunei]
MAAENLLNKSVQKETENVSVQQLYLGENDERAMLIKGICKIQKDIRKFRSQLADGYMRTDISMKEIIKNMRQRTVNNENVSKGDRVRTACTLELMFYGMFMKMDICKDQKNITVLLTVPGKQNFGLSFIQNTESGLYKLHRCCLPYSLNTEEERRKAKSLSQTQIVQYVESIRANTYAYRMRFDQVKQLQMRVDVKQVDLYHSMCYKHIELLFRVKVRENGEYRVTLRLHYKQLEVRPSYINIVTPDSEMPIEQLGAFLKKLQLLKGLPLSELYDKILNAESPLTLL